MIPLNMYDEYYDYRLDDEPEGDGFPDCFGFDYAPGSEECDWCEFEKECYESCKQV